MNQILYNKHSILSLPLPSYHFTSSQDIKMQIILYRLAKEISGARKARFLKEIACLRVRIIGVTFSLRLNRND